jgi:serine/threonine protein kinase
MDHYEAGDLRRFIKMRRAKLAKRGFFREKTVMMYFLQLCLGMKHIHDLNVLHRDLKSSNIFVTREHTGCDAVQCQSERKHHHVLKIGDFGISRIMESTQDLAQTRIGTRKFSYHSTSSTSTYICLSPIITLFPFLTPNHVSFRFTSLPLQTMPLSQLTISVLRSLKASHTIKRVTYGHLVVSYSNCVPWIIHSKAMASMH